MKDNNINGFPTIKVFNNGESEEYNGRRDKESIIDFIKKHKSKWRIY